MSGMLVAGLSLVGLGSVLAARRSSFDAGLVVQAVGAAVVAFAGFWVLGSGVSLGEGFTSAFLPRLGVDGLSGFFLGTLGVVAAPAALFSIRYLPRTAHGRVVASLTGWFVLA